MELKIGVGIPCHKRDIPLLERYTLPSLLNLNPSPYKILILINEGTYTDLKEIKTEIYDSLFKDYDCDIVLTACADYLFVNKTLMLEVHPDKVMNYGRMLNTPIIGLMWVIARRLVKKPWSACHSMPKKIWFETIRDSSLYDGTDGSIPIIMNMCFESHRGINYILMRRNTKRIVNNALFNPIMRKKHIIKRILKLTQGLPI